MTQSRLDGYVAPKPCGWPSAQRKRHRYGPDHECVHCGIGAEPKCFNRRGQDICLRYLRHPGNHRAPLGGIRDRDEATWIEWERIVFRVTTSDGRPIA